jgi:Mn2+/Fe2+ NRAMP family transporter
MTRLSASGVRSPTRNRHLPNEDRLTYRRWARRVCAAYFAIIVALAISLAMHDRRSTQLVGQDQTVGTVGERQK